MMIPSSLYPRSRQPLFMQAAGQLRLKIENGDWLPGGQIPVIEHLQQAFGLSRATIRQALDLLEEEGLIARRRGRGTFVSAQLPERRSHVLPTRWDDLLASLDTLKPELDPAAGRRGRGMPSQCPHGTGERPVHPFEARPFQKRRALLPDRHSPAQGGVREETGTAS